jgi:hypothetical protein
VNEIVILNNYLQSRTVKSTHQLPFDGVYNSWRIFYSVEYVGLGAVAAVERRAVLSVSCLLSRAVRH